MRVETPLVAKSAFPEKAGVVAPTALLETKSMSQYTLEEYNPPGQQIVRPCRECGSPVSRSPSEMEDDKRPFCSRDCYHDWRRGRTFGSPDGKESYTCEECGDTFEKWPSQGKRRFCSAECRHDWLSSRTGQDHPLWEGGVDWYRAIRSAHGPTGWHTQRKEHLADECENCGEGEATLSLHHIVPVLAGGPNASWNYMTLCRTCHQRAEDYCRDLPGMEAVLTE
jgi:endogenous inhibitor of DNA gyrase (YacG/DUF329 family)